MSENKQRNGVNAPGNRLERKLAQAKIAIWLQRFWLAIWPPAAVALAFITISLFGLWSLLPPQAHQIALWMFAAAGAASLWPLLRLRGVSRKEAIERVQGLSNLTHRPVSSYEDTLTAAQDDEASHRLWAEHKKRMARRFANLKAGWPNPRVDRKDPWALRAPLLLLFALGLVIHGGEWRQRMAAAFDVKAPVSAERLRIDAWITPPPYTSRAPSMLPSTPPAADSERAAAILEAPENSELVIRINHAQSGSFGVRIEAPDSEGAKELTPQAAAGVAEFREKLTATASVIATRDGGEIMRWAINVIDDKPPSIALTDPIALSQRSALHLKYKVEDDYGVASARGLVIQAPTDEPSADAPPQTLGDAAPRRLGEPPVIALSLPRASMKSGTGQTYKDLTSHPWAGLPVTLTLVAEDQAGQVGGSDAGRFILPERRFTKPLARALIEQRKALVNEPHLTQQPAQALDALAVSPENFTQDYGLYLALRTVYWRLQRDPDRAGVEIVVNDLWDLALKIEDGDLPDAEKRLREAQEKLAEALDKGASDEEIEKLMAELREAMSAFLQAMQQNAQDPSKQAQQPSNQGQQVTSKDLEKMLKNIEDLAKTGARDAARQMLSELQQMMENLQTAQRQPANPNQQMMESIDKLSDMMTRQQKLLDETYEANRQQQDGSQPQEGEQGQEGENRQNGQRGSQRGQNGQGGEPQSGARRGEQRQGQQGQGPAPSMQELQQRQQALENELNQLMQEMQGASPDTRNKLNEAARAMGEAGQALGQQDPAGAAQQEATAVDKLRQGAKAMAEQMMQAQPGQEGPRGQQGGNAPRDPLGRPNRSQGADNGDSVKVPEEMDIQRAREILDELRKRLGERYRPEMELEYLDRLIKRF